MDVAYHRNCLDGIFSAYLLYLFSKSLTHDIYQKFVDHLESIKQNALHQFKIPKELKLINYDKITEDFFHSETVEIPFQSISMYAGQFFPILPSKKGNILFIVDISPTDKPTLIKLSDSFKQVIIIEHHSSFIKTKEFIEELKRPNIHYIWQQSICAAQLVLSFLHKAFLFPTNYPKQLTEELFRQIQFVGKNDLKKHQDKISKQFVLGFYYFDIEMSHHNPFLFKRLWSMKSATILEKGQNLLASHLQKLKLQIANAELWKCNVGKYKGIQFFGHQLKDRGIISDMGSLLAYLSVHYGYQNLTFVINKKSDEYKISARSSSNVEKQPLALQIAKIYGGGGHKCAAGCTIPKNTFKSSFTCLGKYKPKIQLNEQQIMQILFFDSQL